MSGERFIGTIDKFHSKNRSDIVAAIYKDCTWQANERRKINNEIKYLGLQKLNKGEIEEMITRLSKPIQCKKELKKISNDTNALTNAEKKYIVEENVKRLTHQQKKGNFTHRAGKEHYEACGIFGTYAANLSDGYSIKSTKETRDR